MAHDPTVSTPGYGRLHTSLARIIHLSPKSMHFDARDTRGHGHPSDAIQRRVQSLYDLMASLRDDSGRGSVPVTLMVSQGTSALDATLPGLYQMDGLGDLVVASTDGVDFIERLPLGGSPGRTGTFH